MGDRVMEAYSGQLGEAFQQDTRDRILWICKQVYGHQVLDVGCSQGIVEIILAREGYKVCGIDLDHDALTYARAELAKESPFTQENVTFWEGSFLDYNTDTVYDTIAMTELLEHLTNPVRFLTHALQMLKADGVLIVTLPFGLCDYPDHKHTYYLTDSYQLLSAFCSISEIKFFKQWIGFVCRKSNAPSVALSSDLYAQAESVMQVRERQSLSQVKNLQARAKMLAEKLDTYAAKIDQSKTQIAGAEAENKNLLKALEEERQAVTALTEKLDSCATKIEQSKAQIVDAEGENKSLRKTLEEERQAMIVLTEKLDAYAMGIEQSKAQTADAEAENKCLRRILEEERQAATALKGKLCDHLQMIQKLEEALKRIQLNMSDTEALAEQKLLEQKNEYEKILSELKTKLDKAQMVEQKLLEQKNEYTKNLSWLKTKLDAAQKANQKLLEQKLAQKNEYTKNLSWLKTKLDKAQKAEQRQLEQKLTQKNEYEKKQSELRIKLDKTQRELRQAKLPNTWYVMARSRVGRMLNRLFLGYQKVTNPIRSAPKRS